MRISHDLKLALAFGQVRVRDRRSVGWNGLRGETCAGAGKIS